jgi:uncharacterized membrane protein
MISLNDILRKIILPLVIILILDSIFIYSHYDDFSTQVIRIQKTAMTVNPIGVFLSYFFIVAILYYFILRKNQSPNDALILGVCSYGIYDATSYALLKNWNPTLAMKDTLWGGILFYITTWLVYKIDRVL